jgi:hypothetical protein
MDKKELIAQIEAILNSTGGDSSINKEYLEVLSQEDLLNMFESLKNQQKNFQKETNEWFDDLFGKPDTYN